MKRILLIKLTSLGDLIHVLPALSDAASIYPNIEFDWMIDEGFHEVALWHSNVKRLYMTNHRKWRWNDHATFRAIGRLLSDLKKEKYDLVIDAQGNFKTALLSLFTKGVRVGFDKHSVREKIAHFAYQRSYAASKKAHAVDRLRRLFASALDYPFPLSSPDFGIRKEKFLKPSFALPASYLFFVHSASWKTKLWPEAHWIELIKMCVSDGFQILLPWGSEEELARARRLALFPQVLVLPKLTLSEIGYIVANAAACVCMDTGLSHLAAALNIPSVTLYGATDSGLIGANGGCQLHLQSSLDCSPCRKKKCRFSDAENRCLAEITPDLVYNSLLRQASLRYL